jgi:phage repressor protein C with HTH and peptisase S24 domain
MAQGKTSRAQSVRRFVVAEDSMLPTLRPGDGLLAVRCRRIRRGQLRVFEHPGRAGFWLVKRVGDVRGERFQALSDNPSAAAVDSRRFGDVPIAESYRVIVRVPFGTSAP